MFGARFVLVGTSTVSEWITHVDGWIGMSGSMERNPFKGAVQNYEQRLFFMDADFALE